MLPALQIRQSHVSPTLRADWPGFAAELLTTSSPKSYDFQFDGQALYLCFGLSGRRKDSVVKVDGERSARFIEVANRFDVVPAGARFEGYSVPDTQQRFVQIYLDPRAGALHPEIDLSSIGPRLAASDPVLSATARKFEAALQNMDPMGRVYGEALACTLAVELVRWQHGTKQALRKKAGTLTPHQFHRVTSFIREHLADDISLGLLAGLVGLSPWHFCRAFRQTSGMAPHQWIQAVRIERAQELLGCETLSVTDVALCVGFKNASHFARSFRAIVGTSPREYRRQR